MFNVYHDYYYRIYSAKRFTFPHFLCLLIAYISIALPFYFCFAGTNFWTDTHTQIMNVNYNYTGYYAVQVNYLNSATFITHQYSNIPGNGIATVSSFSATVSNNDQSNTSTVSIALTGYNSMTVLSTNVILYYDVEVPAMEKIVSQALAFTVPGDINTASLSGVVKIQGNKPIEGLNSAIRTNFPLYYPYQASGFTFSTLSNYAYQNTAFLKTTTQSSLILGAPTSGSRSITLTLNKLKSTMVNYTPTLLQTLKFKYSSYLAFAIISYYIFSTLFSLYVKEGMLESQTTTEKIKTI